MDEAVRTSPLVVAILGMGTVFLCLMAIYALMGIMGKTLSRMNATAQDAESAGETAMALESAAGESPQLDASEGDDMAAVIALALARSRTVSIRAPEKGSEGENPWKMAGRLRGLRKR